jgi:putative transposase
MLYRSSHSVYDCRYHLIWCVKYRKRALSHEHEREECKRLLRRIASEYGMEIYTIEVDADHVHLNIQIPPQQSVGAAVRILKSNSARMLFKRFPYLKRKLWAGKFWSPSYTAKSIGEGVTAEMVARYIELHEKRALEPVQQELHL